nr:Crp/Fnr family transcriptional regulator [uncultured Chryseobacterium sp.]
MNLHPLNTDIFYEHINSYIKINTDDFENFLSSFKPIYLKKGEHHYEAGKIPRYTSFVVKGCLRQYLFDENGCEQTVQFYDESMWAGDVESMINRIPTKTNLQAIEDSVLLSITGDNMCLAIENTPWLQHYTIVKNFSDNAKMIEENNLQKNSSPEDLYLNILKNRPSLILRVPQKYIANYLGIRKETLSRIRKRITKK